MKCSKCGLDKLEGEFYKRYRQCKSCTLKQQSNYDKTHTKQIRDRKREWGHRTGRYRPMSEAMDCGLYLGVHVAEQAPSSFFNHIERMPINTQGYDFLCGHKSDYLLFKVPINSIPKSIRFQYNGEGIEVPI